MKMLWRALLAVVLGAAMLPFLSSTAQAATTYTLSGTVTGLSSSGSEVGLSGVQVEAWSPDGPTANWVDETTTTQSDGTYNLTVPRGGHYEFYAHCNSGCTGYASAHIGDVSVTGDTTQNLHMSLLTTLTLYVKDTAGAAVTRPLSVSANYASGGSDGITVTGPSATGAYTLTNVSADTTLSVNDTLGGTPAYANWYRDGSSNFLDDSAAAQSRTITLAPWTGIRAKAVAPDGTPLSDVRWNVFTKDPITGTWDHGLQMGPLLTDNNGRMSWGSATIGSSYKFCFYDDDYDFNTRSERYADTCWTNSPTEDTATVWTPTQAAPVLDPTMTLQPAGKSLTVGHPWIDGVAKVGQQLTVRPGTWGPDGVALTYQWVTNVAGDITPIGDATGPTFTPTAVQDGKQLAVQVTGTLAGYRAHTVYAGIGEVGGSTPAMTGSLKISGTAMPGNTVTAVPGTITPSDTNVSYYWYVNGKQVTGNGNTLDLTPAMAGGSLEVDMTAYNWNSAVSPGCCTDQLYASSQATIGGGVTGTKPTISGTAIVGNTLTATDGAWGPTGVSVTHQWLRNGSPISGATAASYALTTADIGAKISVRVSGTLTGGYPVVSKASDSTAAVQGVLTAATPSISGDAIVGQTLTADPGTWAPAGVGFAYQWYAGGSVISDATESTYKLTAAEVGKAITVKVTGSLTNYGTQSKTSAATSAVQGVLTAGTPKVSGTTTVGSTLTVDPGTWTPAGVGFAYQWYAGGSAISDATESTYKLTTAEVGKTITVEVTGSLTNYGTQSKPSAATSEVLDVFTATPTPTVVGTSQAGSVLTADAGDWGVDGVTLTYQWLRDGSVIGGATGPSYAVTAADRGHGISVHVTASKTGYADAEQTSAATVIAGVFTATPTPRITGTTVVGKKLAVRTGSWSPAPEFAYQWFRNGKAIAHASGTTYRLVTADGGARITVRVTASRSGYENVGVISKATASITKLFAKSSKPKIKGMTKVGKKLTAKHGTWSPKPSYRYQWLRNGKVIKGATHATYKLKKADRGKKIKVRMTSRRSGYLAVTETSKATKKIAR